MNKQEFIKKCKKIFLELNKDNTRLKNIYGSISKCFNEKLKTFYSGVNEKYTNTLCMLTLYHSCNEVLEEEYVFLIDKDNKNIIHITKYYFDNYYNSNNLDYSISRLVCEY